MNIDEIKQRVLSDVDPKLKDEKRKTKRRSALITAGEFIGITALIFLVFGLIFGLSEVEGMSMFPTLKDGDRVVYLRRVREYKVGDIVAIDRPGEEGYVKRVAAVAGDVVNIIGGELYVNGKAEGESGAAGRTEAVGAEISYPLTVGPGEVFVLGDNRENSVDSRSFGPIPTEQIKGKLRFYYGTIE